MACTWKDVVRVARELAEVEESTTFGNACLKAKGKLIAWRKGHSGDDGVVLFRVELFERELLLQAAPKVFFLMDHYNDYPAVLAHMKALSQRELRERLRAAIALSESKKKRAATGAGRRRSGG